MNWTALAPYGPWALVLGLIGYIVRELVAKGYCLKFELGPKQKS